METTEYVVASERFGDGQYHESGDINRSFSTRTPLPAFIRLFETLMETNPCTLLLHSL